MGEFFTRERFGRPQILAGFLLVMFMGQCFWLLLGRAQREAVDSAQLFRVQEGLLQWRRQSIAGTPSTNRIEGGTFPPPEVEQNEGYDPDHSPLWYLLASAALLGWHPPDVNTPLYWGWLERLPYIVFGVLLGASVWYVARRLYGNAGGYVAVTLYCFSPAILRSSTLWFAEPEMGAAWGTFGAIFTAIAVAHTLYAPREVVLWNWRRILLLGLSLALAVGCQFSLIVLVPLALAFMLYVAPTRRKAAIVIWLAGCVVALLLLLAAYGFRVEWFWQGIRHARFFPMNWQAFTTKWSYQRMLGQIGQAGPALLVTVPAMLIVYCMWPRSRYFGNTAPLVVAGLFLALGMGMPHFAGAGFLLMAVPFLFVFVAGVVADLLETRQRGAVLACIIGLLVANAFWNFMELARVGRG
ncbi:MAG: hypothetical protein ACLP6G_13605 [Terriglobales bacterium]